MLDGRDIGTVIAPEAEVNIFVTATSEIRVERRFAELKRAGLDVHLPDVLADIRVGTSAIPPAPQRRSPWPATPSCSTPAR